LRIADGIPTLINSNGLEQFPMDGKTVFTLENIHDHQTYDNDPNTTKKLHEKEMAEVQRIMDVDETRMRQEMRQKGYSGEQIERILLQWANGNDAYEEAPVRRGAR